MRAARLLTVALLAVMVIQAALGRIDPAQYRDVDWIRASWFGNDWVTLTVAAPLLFVGLIGTARGEVRGLLVWLGMIGYGLYNSAFYLFGAALNAFFPIYVLAFVLSVVALTLALSRVDAHQVAASFHQTTPVRFMGGSLIVIGIGLASVWIGMWAAYVFTGRPTPVAPDAFRLVAALDLSLMVPALTVGGILLWQRAPWGYVIAAIASIQGALYLFVLSVNSLVAIQRGFVSAPGELPVWGPLTIVMTLVVLILLGNIRQNALPCQTLSALRHGQVVSSETRRPAEYSPSPADKFTLRIEPHRDCAAIAPRAMARKLHGRGAMHTTFNPVTQLSCWGMSWRNGLNARRCFTSWKSAGTASAVSGRRRTR